MAQLLTCPHLETQRLLIGHDSDSNVARLMRDAARAYRNVVQQLGSAQNLLKNSVLTDAEFKEARAPCLSSWQGACPLRLGLTAALF